MDILKKIETDLINALKSGNSEKLSVLRMIKAALKNKEIEHRSKGVSEDETLSEDEVFSILNREVKKRKEAIELFKKGERSDLVYKENQELKIIEEYLPKALSDDEIEIEISAVLDRGDYGLKDFGLVMKEVMKKLKGKVGGEILSAIIKKRLGDK